MALARLCWETLLADAVAALAAAEVRAGLEGWCCQGHSWLVVWPGGSSHRGGLTLLQLCMFLKPALLMMAVAIAACHWRSIVWNGACLPLPQAQAVTPALERIIEANTLLSGLGFESGGLAVAHALHAGLTAAPGSHAYLHGEKVGAGRWCQRCFFQAG